MQIVADAETGEILGGTIPGTGGDEAIHSILDMMAAGARCSTLTRTMHIRPTASELIPTIAGEMKPVLQASAPGCILIAVAPVPSKAAPCSLQVRRFN